MRGYLWGSTGFEEEVVLIEQRAQSMIVRPRRGQEREVYWILSIQSYTQSFPPRNTNESKLHP